MARVFLTGGSGFVGRTIHQECLSRGDVVVSTASKAEHNYIGCDITDSTAVMGAMAAADPDVIIHSAAISTAVHSDVLSYYSINVVGTKNVLAAAKALRRRTRFVLLSTAGVYGNQLTEVLHEELVPSPVHDYGMSKLCAELSVKSCRKFCDFTIIRPFNVVGPAQSGMFIMPKLAKAFGRGDQQVSLGNIDVFRDYIDVRSCAKAIVELANSSLAIGEVVNLCSGIGISLRMAIEAFQQAAGYEIDIVRDPALIRPDEVWRLIGSREKLERLAPGAPISRPLQEMVQEMFEFYRKQSQSAVEYGLR